MNRRSALGCLVIAIALELAACRGTNPTNRPAAEHAKPYVLKFCVVGHEPLGADPTPIEIIYSGRVIRLATPSCAEKFRADPDKYVKAVENAEQVFATSKGFTWVEPKEYERLRSRGDVVVLDVRTPKEFAAGHVPGALNLDLNGSDFTNRVETLDKSKTYLVNCTAGVRGAKACDLLRRLQFPRLFNLDGGLAAWEHAGNRPETGLPATNGPATH